MKTWDLERRIRRAWDIATSDERLHGRSWYRTAHEQVKSAAAVSRTPIGALAAVVAAISPGLRWDRNVFWAAELAIAWKEQRAESLKVPTYSYGNVRKAIRILAGESPEEVLRGPKVTAFWQLILRAGEDRNAVCIDGHAYALAVGWDGPIRKDPDTPDAECVRISKPELRRVREAYRKLARKIGVYPHELQATTWLVRKRLREGSR